MSTRTDSAGQHLRPDWLTVGVLLLTVATGVVEAVSIVHLGGVFAAFATGTLVLAGVHLGSGAHDFAAMLPAAVAFGGFVLGGLVGGALVRGVDDSKARPLTRSLAVETALLLIAGGVRTVVAPSRATDLVTLALLALAMSIQFSATRFLNIPDLRFAAATGLVHGLFHDVTFRKAVPPRLFRRLCAAVSLPAGAALGVAVAVHSVGAAILVAGLVVAVGAAISSHAVRDDLDHVGQVARPKSRI